MNLSEVNKLMRFPFSENETAAEVLKKFPVLKSYPEFENILSGADGFGRLKYILLCYDRNIHHLFGDDVEKKRELCALLAGFEKPFSENVLDMMDCRESITNRAAQRFLVIHSTTKYQLYRTLQDTFFNILVRLQTGIQTENEKDEVAAYEKLSKMRQEVIALESNITTIGAELFGVFEKIADHNVNVVKNYNPGSAEAAMKEARGKQ